MKQGKRDDKFNYVGKNISPLSSLIQRIQKARCGYQDNEEVHEKQIDHVCNKFAQRIIELDVHQPKNDQFNNHDPSHHSQNKSEVEIKRAKYESS